MALFDVLMPVKNGEAFIGRAIDSVQAQTRADWRLIVLDHGSTDGTQAIVSRYVRTDRRVVCHAFPSAEGLSGLLNEGLSLVEAPYAMRMDADDECTTDRMALTEQAFQAEADLIVVGGQADVIDERGATVDRLSVPCQRDALARVSLFRNAVLHPTVCFRSSALFDRQIVYGRSIHQAVDPGASISMPSLAEDYLLFGELALERSIVNLPHTVLRYRVHAGGVSSQKSRQQRIASVSISRHLAALVSRARGLQPFDPAPFCSHGQSMTDVENRQDYRHAYEYMREVLSGAGEPWKDAHRELDWRSVFVDRAPLAIAWRAACQYRRCQPGEWERRTVVNTVQQRIRGKPGFSVDGL